MKHSRECHRRAIEPPRSEANIELVQEPIEEMLWAQNGLEDEGLWHWVGDGEPKTEPEKKGVHLDGVGGLEK